MVKDGENKDFMVLSNKREGRRERNRERSENATWHIIIGV